MNQPHLTYLRHTFGSGKLFDSSEACERSHVDRLSEICDESSVWNSRITGSRIEASLVTNAVVKNSVVIASDVTGGIIENSLISCELITGNVRLKNCRITGKTRVAHRAFLSGVSIRNLTVKGTAILGDWHQQEDEVFDGCHGYVSRGVWLRPPRVFSISPTITVTESVRGFAYVHCREYPIEKWLRIGRRYGAKCGWTAEEVKAVRKVMHLLQRT